jgi:hypothetical protein
VALVGHVAMSSAGNNLPRIIRGILARSGAASTPELVVKARRPRHPPPVKRTNRVLAREASSLATSERKERLSEQRARAGENPQRQDVAEQ